ncbi:hypothetical protein P5V15_010217 [Pogonomyrmex californicus]
MMDVKDYVIVEFDDGIQIISKLWINSDTSKVRWPTFSSQKCYDKAIKLMKDYQDSWPEVSIKGILGSTSSYEKAREKLVDAEIFCDVPTGSVRDEMLKRIRKIRARHNRFSDESSEDNNTIEVPPFPKVPEKTNFRYTLDMLFALDILNNYFKIAVKKVANYVPITLESDSELNCHHESL